MRQTVARRVYRSSSTTWRVLYALKSEQNSKVSFIKYTRAIRNHQNNKLYRKEFRYLFQVLYNKDVRLSGNFSKLPYHFKIGREAVLLSLCKLVHFYTLTCNVRYFFSDGMKNVEWVYESHYWAFKTAPNLWTSFFVK